MDSSKIKNLMITILLCLNVMLIAINAYDQRQMREMSSSALESAVSILEINGIAVDDNVRLDIEAPRGCTVVRDDDREKDNIRNLIGNGAMEDLGGNIRYYNGSGGQTSYRGTGEMDMLLEEGVVKTGRDAVKTALRTMKKIGLSGDDSLAEQTVSGDNCTVVVCCCWEDSVVYNAKLTFSFASGRLIMISGTRTFEERTAVSEAEPMSYASAIMRFIEMINENGYVCSRIIGFDAGYIMDVQLSGESTLTPVWRIETDTGIYFINAENGRQENIAA